MNKLTQAEERIMQILWEMEKGFVKDILEQFPEPKPNYNTVSTITRILEKKGFVDHKAYGNSHQYYPLITKDEYKQTYLQEILQDYFGNSFTNLVSFFSEHQDLEVDEVEEALRLLKKLRKQAQ
ncbi:MAG: BlaI/MecI/CopY family transcriptional regulator [Sedimentisphaerales bacterium]|nr:BlaI/MecI/CopY family transcriptional regulator [Sedimentisphaerales bacterium]